MPLQAYAVPVEYVSPIVLALGTAVAYQTQRLREATRRMERLHDEDRQRAVLEEERERKQAGQIEELQAERDELRARLRRKRRRRRHEDVDEDDEGDRRHVS